MKKLIYSIFKKFGLRVSTYSNYQHQQLNINKLKNYISKLEFLILHFNKVEAAFLFENINGSKSQINQDLFVLSELKMKKNGYFVEVGATNGIYLSNTYILEKVFNWDGLLVEPAKIWHKELKQNRDCDVDFRCVLDHNSGLVAFTESKDSEYSTIKKFKSKDLHKDLRKREISTYKVQTVSLEDLLEENNCPNKIDYLSIDTEGSEYEIIKNFNFSKYDISCLTIEHNNTVNKEKIDDIVINNGFQKVFEDISQFESWYIRFK